jgi:nicotinamide riboside transporter PnuC
MFVLAILANILIIKKNKLGYVIFTITNIYYMILNIRVAINGNPDVYAFAASYLVYTGLSIYGYLQWRNSNDF